MIDLFHPSVMSKNLKRKRDQDAKMEEDGVSVMSILFGLTYRCPAPRLGGSHVGRRS